MREFELITKLLKPLAGKDSANLSDDCAFFNGYCITKDVLISGVHFMPGDNPYKLAQKALRVNLSDLASSGAKPFGFMLGLALPKNTTENWLVQFTGGLKSDIGKYNFQLLGGDTTYHDGGLVISITALGKAEKPITRSGAKAGDNIFVSGTIGKGWLGLQAKLKGEVSDWYELPEPRFDIDLSNATASIDISDGLLADLGHICRESGVGAEIHSSLIPLADRNADLLKQITGGDDYELCFTSAKNEVSNCTKIGIITAGKELLLDGKKVEAKGYEHKPA